MEKNSLTLRCPKCGEVIELQIIKVAKQQPASTQEVKEAIDEWIDDVEVTEENDSIVVMPKGFLGKELWYQINNALKTFDTEWLSAGKESIAFNQLGYETGARYNEAERLEWTDIDPERCKITIKASKNGKARILTVSRELIDRLMSLPRVSKTVFPPRNKNTRRVSFRRKMKTLARIHNNPRFLKIRYHTFRHCKALREYHKTRSILHVKKVLGHRSILTTQRYVDLYTEIYGDLHSEDYVCETASTVEEAKKLIEAGFEYVTTIKGEQLYRKVK